MSPPHATAACPGWRGKRAVKEIADRVGPIVERVRSAQHLDAVTEEAAGGLWDADITAEVIRLYEEKYPAPSPT